MAKLTDQEIRLLLKLRFVDGMSMRALASRFGVCLKSVFNYVHGIHRV